MCICFICNDYTVENAQLCRNAYGVVIFVITSKNIVFIFYI